jgi:predicted DCC family thiol-disulfide oxidoreductase YuxK
VQYCRNANINDPFLLSLDPKTANFVLATYAAKLLTGKNCNNLNIRATTVTGYLQAAQDLMKEGGYSHCDGLPLDSKNELDTKMFIRKAKRWEGLPNRRLSITDMMADEIYLRHLSVAQDSLEDCFYDWLALGRYTGFHCAEWAQTRKLSFERIGEDNPAPRAMIDGDWLFFDEQGRLLDKNKANIRDIYRVDICWRVQKNGQNGEIISYWRDDIDPRWCPVRAAWRICMRARRLGIPLDEPLAKYLDHNTGRIVFINATEVEALLRDVAIKTTNIQDTKLIHKMYGMHSIRVTACNELARLNVSDSFIQRRLRWRSNTFLDYLRNNIYTAQRHNLSRNIKYSPHDTDLHKNLLPHTNGGAITCC